MTYIIAGIIHFALLLGIRHWFGFEVAVLYGLMTFNTEVVKGFREGIKIKS